MDVSNFIDEYAQYLYQEFLLRKSLTHLQFDMLRLLEFLSVYDVERAYTRFQELIKKGVEYGKDEENES